MQHVRETRVTKNPAAGNFEISFSDRASLCLIVTVKTVNCLPISPLYLDVFGDA
jgi:hypothetical protein